MLTFTTPRERRLWLWILIILVAIYASLGLAGKLAGILRNQGLLGASYALGFLMVIVVIATSGLKTQPGKIEVIVGLGVTAAYFLAIIRMGIPSGERTHLIEYGIVAVLIHQALMERVNHGRRVPRPALVTIILTALLGWLDEGIQAMLPNRVYDLRDVAFNALAGLMAITASLVLSQARHWHKKRTTK